MQVRVQIVEDELIVAEEIKETLIESGFDVVGVADNHDDAVQMAVNEKPDIILQDVHIVGDKDGITTAEAIKEHLNHVAVIFLTAFSDTNHLNRAKSTNPAAYIVKPFDTKNLAIAVDLAFSNLQNGNGQEEEEPKTVQLSDRIFIKDNGRYSKLLINDIQYVEAFGSYCEVQTERHRHTFSFNLKHLAEKINHHNIYRVHRSFMVNLEKIDAIDGNMIVVNEKSIPIGNSFRKDFQQKFNLI